MIYPTINKLTQGKYNRYQLAVATAKGARIITNEYTEDALARTEEAVRMALEEVQQSRMNFRSASSSKMQEAQAKMSEAVAEENNED